MSQEQLENEILKRLKVELSNDTLVLDDIIEYSTEDDCEVHDDEMIVVVDELNVVVKKCKRTTNCN